MPKETRVVSVRVPVGLPEKVKAATGLPFSQAVVVMFEGFIKSQQRKDDEAKALVAASREEPK
jgi:hypothetical protein